MKNVTVVNALICSIGCLAIQPAMAHSVEQASSTIAQMIYHLLTEPDHFAVLFIVSFLLVLWVSFNPLRKRNSTKTKV